MMGSPLVLFFVLPIVFVVTIFNTLSAALTGTLYSEVVLPYEPEKGIVWEYKEDDDMYIDLIDEEIKGDKQIFTFRGDRVLSEHKDSRGEVMDLRFVDENGDEQIYYAIFNSEQAAFFNKYDIYAPGEYVAYEYTVKAENKVLLGFWEILWSDSEMVLYSPKEFNDETVFTIVHPLNQKGEEFTLGFYYYQNSSKKETIVINYEITENGLNIKNENHIIH